LRPRFLKSHLHGLPIASISTLTGGYTNKVDRRFRDASRSRGSFTLQGCGTIPLVHSVI